MSFPGTMSAEPIRVLIVDDSEEDAIVASRMLTGNRKYSFETEWAPSVAAGLAALNHGAYDAGLIDYYLGDENGLDLVRLASERGCQTPLIILTAVDSADSDLRTIQGGADEYLVKGRLDSELLCRVVLHAIERRRARQRTDELSAAISALQREVAQRVETEQRLKDAIVHLEQHDKEKSEFVATVSHELKTPLTSMMYGTRNLLHGLAGPLPAEAVKYLQMIDGECFRLVNTINDILDLSKLDNAALKLSTVTAPLARIIHRSVENLRVQVETARLSIDVAAGTDAGFVRCDPAMILRVLTNVLANAIKFTPAGGEIHIGGGPAPDAAGMARIVVRDNGTGIPGEMLHRVTERYFRAGNHPSGSGLGLAISKEIVALHGGSIHFASPAPGRNRGTEVSILLPVAPPPRLLVLDDDSYVLQLMGSQLKQQGYLVEGYTGGKDALARIRKGGIDLLILDMVLKDISGQQVILALKQTPAIRYLPVLVVTGATLDSTMLEVLTGFGIPALSKPWSRQVLIDAVETALIGMTAFG